MLDLLAIDRSQVVPQSCRLNTIACKNIWSMTRTLDTSQFEMSALNDVARRNIAGILIALDTSHFEMSLLNDVATINILDMSCTLDTSQFERSLLNDGVLMNTSDMSVTPDTSHFETSPLKSNALVNMWLMSMTRDTSHSEIGPSWPMELSPAEPNLRHASTALWSSAFDENAVLLVLLGSAVDRITCGLAISGHPFEISFSKACC